ncbi:hypothetical protein J7E25_11865 [Agromyces sp. ISL-38]|nr:hypothetical protein [Agromyces sp. ISL-38]MBT2499791.1 hypothetical protein [Agromyces sp. ISL-38]
MIELTEDDRFAFLARQYPAATPGERAELRVREWLGDWELDAAVRDGF